MILAFREQSLISFYIFIGRKNSEKEKKWVSNMNVRLLQMFAQKKQSYCFFEPSVKNERVANAQVTWAKRTTE